MSYTYNFPSQRIPESEKTEEWHKQHITEYLTYTGTEDFAEKKEEIASLYYAYSGKLSPEEKEKVRLTITERCGENLGPEFSVYPLIENKIDELVGKYRKRPLKRHLSVSNPDAVIKKLDDKLDMVTEQLLRPINEEMQSEIGFAPETENPDIQLPEDIEEFFSKDYRTLAEDTGENILNQVLIVKKEKEKIFESLKHYLISERCFAFLDEKNGHPSLYIPHVLDCFADSNPNESVQSNHSYFSFDKFMDTNEIFNTFENISESDKMKIENYSGMYKSGGSAGVTMSSSGATDLWFKNEGGRFKSRVVSMIWKSRKKVRFLSINNKETGAEEFKIVDDTFNPRKNRDVVKFIEIEDIRHITMAGPDVVLSWGSLKDQMQTIADKKVRFLPVVGLIKNNPIGTGEIRSVAKKLEYLQRFASEILYEIRLAARQVDGNIAAYDLAMIPTEWLKNGQAKALEKVDFHIKRDRRLYYNSKDKRTQPYASSINMSNQGHMRELVETLSLIEDLSDKISGVRSNSNPYQKAATAEINYQQDTDRIEEYFGLFDTYIETVLERLLLKGKHVYKENDVFSYFAGDGRQKFMQIYPDYFLNDYGIHIADNRREFEKKKRLDEMAGNTFSNASSPQLIRDLLKIWNSETVTEAEGIFDRGLNALEKLRQENMKMQQQQAEQMAQVEREKLEQKTTADSEKLINNKEVALIYANNNADGIGTKETNANLRKMAEIERDLELARRKNAEKSENSK